MKLHKKQTHILELLIKKGNDQLTLRDIMEQVDGLTSPSHVQHHLSQLEKKGYLKRNPSNPRNYQILIDPEKPISHVNLYGMAKCGPKGTLLSGEVLDRVPIYSKLIRFSVDQAFLVEALGDSMTPKIHENDLVIAKKTHIADDGDIVVCTLDNQAMIKKYRSLKNKLIVLESLNKNVEPIVITESQDFQIEGVMKGLICSHSDTVQ